MKKVIIRVNEENSYHILILNENEIINCYHMFYYLVSKYQNLNDKTRVIELIKCRMKKDRSYKILEIIDRIEIEEE